MRKTFGRELRRLRCGAGLTLVDVADEMGWSIVYLSDIERSRRNPPSPRDIEKLLRIIGSIDMLPVMLRLAVEERKSIEIPIDRSSDVEVNDMLVALARQVGEGALDREVAKKIQELLKKQKKEE
jgi:transcriptional regulator with XRE-family HTH domain